jgi:putative SOS response-associated peptidase YedK
MIRGASSSISTGSPPYIAPISNMEPRFNFAPMQRGIVVRPDKEGRREPVMMRWGLVPSWAKDDKDRNCAVGKPKTMGCGSRS